MFLRDLMRALLPKLMHRRALSRERWCEVEELLLPLVVDRARLSIDVGANIGRYAIRLSNLSVWVYAFEPNEEIASFLAKVAPRNLTVFNEAISCSSGMVKYHVPVSEGKRRESLGTIQSPLVEHVTCTYDTRIVASRILDDFADQNVGFVKIDIEGHEYAALLGALQLISKQRPRFLIEIERRHNSESMNNITKLLVEELSYCGFFVYQNSTHSIDSFSASTMQDPAALLKPVPRLQMDYVNNFFFAPSDDDANELRQKIDHFLRRPISVSSDFPDGRPIRPRLTAG